MIFKSDFITLYIICSLKPTSAQMAVGWIIEIEKRLECIL